MMETKVWAALCALLLVNFGSAEHDDAHVASSNSSKSAGEAGHEAPASSSSSSVDPINHTVPSPSLDGLDSNSSSGIIGSLSNDTTAEIISVAPEPKTNGTTTTVSPSEAASPEKNPADQPTSQPPSPPPESDVPTSHIPPNSTTIGSTNASHEGPEDTVSPTNTSEKAAFPLPDSSTQSNPQHKTHSVTSKPTPESPKLDTTTTTIAESSSPYGTSSSHQTPSSVSPMLTSLQNTLQPKGHSETSTVAAEQPSTTAPTSSPPPQTKAHAGGPSQLNVGGDTTMVHESPTLDPLLAGLVSAFIITAVIITLLLFLKLRRRDNRPEFRRLQDLPMDDMEDTPLSMYSY